MKKCELLSCVSVQSGVAVNLSRDLIADVLRNGEVLKPEHFPKLTQIRERIQHALCAAMELEGLANGTKPKDDFWESEQFQLFK